MTTERVRAWLAFVDVSPQSLGYLRSTWSSQLFAAALKARHGFDIHPSTARRLLSKLNIVWRRARPTLNRRVPRKAEKLAAMYIAIDGSNADTAVLSVDEADVDLLPRIGFAWRPPGRAQRSAVVKPG